MPDRFGDPLEQLVVPRLGSVVATGLRELPWLLLDADGLRVESCTAWLLELAGCDYPPSTLRSYAYDLLSWHRFLWAVETPSACSWMVAPGSFVRARLRGGQPCGGEHERRGALRQEGASQHPLVTCRVAGAPGMGCLGYDRA